jgi:hypothetical protein
VKSATRKKEGGERIDDDGGFDARIVWGASLGSSLFSSCAQARKLDVWQGADMHAESGSNITGRSPGSAGEAVLV